MVFRTGPPKSVDKKPQSFKGDTSDKTWLSTQHFLKAPEHQGTTTNLALCMLGFRVYDRKLPFQSPPQPLWRLNRHSSGSYIHFAWAEVTMKTFISSKRLHMFFHKKKFCLLFGPSFSQLCHPNSTHRGKGAFFSSPSSLSTILGASCAGRLLKNPLVEGHES